MTDVKHKSQRSEFKLTPEVRIAFPFVHEKRTKTAAGELLEKPRHDMVLLFPKLHNDATQCPNYAMLAAHCMEAAGKAWPGAGWPQGGKWPIQDGDQPHTPKPKPGVVPKTAEQIAAANAWRKGHWVIEASTNLEPGPRVAVMQNGQAVEIPARIGANGQPLYKSGDYGFVSLNAYSFQNKTFGCNFGFEGVLFSRPGEAIGSSGPKSTAAMFGSVATVAQGAAPAGPPIPGQYAAPPAPAAPVPAAPVYAAPAPVYAAPTAAAPPLPPTYAVSAAPAAPPLPPGVAPPPPLPPMAAPGAPPALPPFPAPG